MYSIQPTTRYKKEYKAISKNPNFKKSELEHVLKCLVNNIELEEKYCDHKLAGYKGNVRECHVQPDILLIYEKDEGKLILHLMRIGNHNSLFNH